MQMREKSQNVHRNNALSIGATICSQCRKGATKKSNIVMKYPQNHLYSGKTSTLGTNLNYPLVLKPYISDMS